LTESTIRGSESISDEVLLLEDLSPFCPSDEVPRHQTPELTGMMELSPCSPRTSNLKHKKSKSNEDQQDVKPSASEQSSSVETIPSCFPPEIPPLEHQMNKTKEAQQDVMPSASEQSSSGETLQWPTMIDPSCFSLKFLLWNTKLINPKKINKRRSLALQNKVLHLMLFLFKKSFITRNGRSFNFDQYFSVSQTNWISWVKKTLKELSLIQIQRMIYRGKLRKVSLQT
jgi:hypothetical protein